MPVIGTKEEMNSGSGKGNEIGDEYDDEDKDNMFRNDAAKSLWSHYRAEMGNQNI